MVRVMICASVVFICISLQPSFLRNLSSSSSRIAYRHTHLAPISRASVCLMDFTSTRRSAFSRDSSIVAFTASILQFLTISCQNSCVFRCTNSLWCDRGLLNNSFSPWCSCRYVRLCRCLGCPPDGAAHR